MKSGFVYLWFDRKHHRFYIGSHWGDVNDGYICSSSWMKRAYKGKKLTEQSKQKLSMCNSGERNPFFGKKHTEETRRKISEAAVKRKLSLT